MEKMEKKVCCICGIQFVGMGNNPWPIKSEEECCDICNRSLVIPARLGEYSNRKKQQENEDV